jgi:hypothetical protein
VPGTYEEKGAYEGKKDRKRACEVQYTLKKILLCKYRRPSLFAVLLFADQKTGENHEYIIRGKT